MPTMGVLLGLQEREKAIKGKKGGK